MEILRHTVDITREITFNKVERIITFTPTFLRIKFLVSMNVKIKLYSGMAHFSLVDR